jgi:hypothetical protein
MEQLLKTYQELIEARREFFHRPVDIALCRIERLGTELTRLEGAYIMEADYKPHAFRIVEIDPADLQKAPDQPLCQHCLAGKELLYNEPGGLKPRASYWHEADNPEDDMIECPRWREHEIVKLNQEIQTLRGHLERIMCKQS